MYVWGWRSSGIILLCRVTANMPTSHSGASAVEYWVDGSRRDVSVEEFYSMGPELGRYRKFLFYYFIALPLHALNVTVKWQRSVKIIPIIPIISIKGIVFGHVTYWTLGTFIYYQLGCSLFLQFRNTNVSVKNLSDYKVYCAYSSCIKYSYAQPVWHKKHQQHNANEKIKIWTDTWVTYPPCLLWKWDITVNGVNAWLRTGKQSNVRGLVQVCRGNRCSGQFSKVLHGISPMTS